MRNGKPTRRRLRDRRPLGRYRVRVMEDPDGPRQRVWWMSTIEARSASEAVLVAKVRLVLEGVERHGADGTAGWGLMAVPEAWWELGAGAALQRGEYPAEVPPVGPESAWDQLVDRALG